MADTAPAWDLEPIYAGGVAGPPFTSAFAQVIDRVAAFADEVAALPGLAEAPDRWEAALVTRTSIDDALWTLASFAGCAYAAAANDTAARLASERTRSLYDRLVSASVPLEAGMDEASDDVFEAFLARPGLVDHRPTLIVERRTRRLRFARDDRSLVAALRPHALLGWGALYDQISGSVEAEIELPGQGRAKRSAAQLQGLLGHPDPATREAAYHGGIDGWSGVRDVCSSALTHITGTRAALNGRRGVQPLADTCGLNRIERATLDALWTASDHAQDKLVAYLDRKAEVMGKPRLDWWDLAAPLPTPGGAEPLAFDHAAELVIDAFRAFDPAMADFAQRAVDSRWVEAEPRPGKRQGGFCSRVGNTGQSRIFMTWAGNLRSALTLAHELGHAWHNDVLFRQPSPQRRVASATAETASTFAEALFRDHLLAVAGDPALELQMLDQELMAGVSFLMNIRARYLFECELYELADAGPLAPDELDAAMLRAQQRAYADRLNSWDPTFWASKLHFYIANFGFYNWPYTFGYLFSTAVYDRARRAGPDFVPTYVRLLSETGYAWTEDAAMSCLGEDITQPDFWHRAARPLLDRVDAFLAATDA